MSNGTRRSYLIKNKVKKSRDIVHVVLCRILGKGLGCVLIKSTLGSGKTQKGWMHGSYGGQWGTKGTVYKQPGTEVDHSCHSWRVPSK
jgi:hypothetical protein